MVRHVVAAVLGVGAVALAMAAVSGGAWFLLPIPAALLWAAWRLVARPHPAEPLVHLLSAGVFGLVLLTGLAEPSGWFVVVGAAGLLSSLALRTEAL